MRQYGAVNRVASKAGESPGAGATIGPRRVTRLLTAWSEGNEQAQQELLPIVYDELSRLAASYLRRERAEHTLQTSDLVHEAYLRLVDQKHVRWQSRTHFFGIAARMMRRVLTDYARRHLSQKRGQGERLSLDDAPLLSVVRAPDLLALDDALDSLAAVAPRQARIVEMRFFGGLTAEETAAVLGVSLPTVTRQWRVARAWLYRALRQGEDRDA